MLQFALRRLMLFFPMLLVASIISFAIIQAPPGDFLTDMVAALAEQGESAEYSMEALRKQYGLDRPIHIQYLKWIWNVLMPDLFGLKEITYWQAFGMVILAKLLFGAFGSHHHDHKGGRPRPFLDWHGTFKRSEYDEPWNKRHKDWKYYKKYWQDEGKSTFEAYMKRIENEE